MKILVADDHWVVRQTLKLLLRQLRPGAEVLEAATFEQARAHLAAHADIELVLADLVMPGFDEFSGLARLRADFPEAPVVVVSTHEEPHWVLRAIGHGVIGYIPKTADAAELERALRRVLAGEVSFPRRIIERSTPGLLPAEAGPAEPPPAPASAEAVEALTEREREIVALMGSGLSVARIAVRLGLAPHTVRVHINNLKRKLGFADRAEAVQFAVRYVEAQARARAG